MAQPNPFAAGTAEVAPEEEQARRDLVAQIPEGLKVDVDSCFPEVTGWKVTRSNKLRMSYLVNGQTLLRACLKPHEVIRYVCLAREQVWWEMLGAGRWAMLLNANVFVVTQDRIVIVHSDGKGRPSRYINQVPLAAIKKLKGFLGRCTIVTPTGSRNFNVGMGDRAQLKIALPEKNEDARGGAEFLCPSCFAVSAEYVGACPSCSTSFKSPKTAAIRSLLVPGLGTWYLGNKWFAVLQMTRGALLWLIMFGVIAGVSSGSNHGDELIGMFVFFGFLLVFVHGIDALLSRASAKKGLIALDLALPARRPSSP